MPFVLIETDGDEHGVAMRRDDHRVGSVLDLESHLGLRRGRRDADGGTDGIARGGAAGRGCPRVSSVVLISGCAASALEEHPRRVGGGCRRRTGGWLRLRRFG